MARAADLNIDSLYLNSARRPYRRPDISNAGIGRDNEKRNGGDGANIGLRIAAEREKRRWERRQPGGRVETGEREHPPAQDRRENRRPAAEWNL